MVTLPRPPSLPRALLFDVFGTLVDWRRSVARQVAAAFECSGRTVDALAFADAWRGEYDPSMEPVRSGRRPYVSLDELHRENLQTVLGRLDLTDVLDSDEQAGLNRSWERLDPWPDSVSGLDRLRYRFVVAPCSNGSVALMVKLARHTGFAWDCILGAEIAGTYKPEPDVYLASCAALQLDPEQVMMIAAHNADLEAASSLGMMTGFFPRPTEHGHGQETDLIASGDWTIVASDLMDLARCLLD